MKSHIPAINSWRGTGKAEDVYAQASAGNAPAPVAAPVAAPIAAPVAAPVAAAPVEAPKPAPVVKKAAPAKKAPSRVEKGTLIEFSDYRNETITIPAEEVQNASKFKFYDCFKCKIIIGGKIAQVELFKCKKCDVSVDEVMNFVGILKCDESKIRIKTKCRTINSEGSSEAQIFVSESSKPEL